MPEFDRSAPVTVAVNLHRGLVDITAEERVSVLAEVHPMDGSEAATQAAADALVSLDGDTLVVRGPEPAGWSFRRQGKLRVTVRVPLDSSLAIKTASADVRATGRYRTAQIDVASGDVRLDDVTGDASIDAASGDLTVGRIGGSLRIHSASGDLEVGDVTGDVNADAASGDIKFGSIGHSSKVSTASGDIEIGALSSGEARVRSASGDITVGVRSGTGVWLDVSTASGKTRNDLTMGTTEPATEQRATLELRIRSASGDISIRRAAPAPSASPAAAA